MLTILSLLDTICFFIFSVFIVYLFLFSVFSLKKRKTTYPAANKNHRFVVLFPAYMEDAVIEQSICDFIDQDYPKDCYDIIVIADKMQDITIERLKLLSIKVWVAEFENSSKAASLNFAMNNLAENDYDVVVIMDADNRVGRDFIKALNNAYDFGIQAMQAHRIAKNKNTDVALLDAASEEINNSFFRRGHINAGLSSALSGSGMAFSFKWFKQNISKVHTVGEDKELELLLLYDKIYIDYLDDVLVWDEKVQKSDAFSRQRQRWLSAQYDALKIGLKKLPGAVLNGNIDYCDKLFQWVLLPRVVMIGLIPLIIFVVTLIHYPAAFKWVGIYFLFLVSLSLALPDELFDKALKKAIRKIPLLFIKMLINFFKIKNKSEGFIHTSHGEDEKYENSN